MYMTTSINLSPTIALVANAEMKAVPGKAVKITADGKCELCAAAGEKVFGIATIERQEDFAAGETVTVQVHGGGVVLAGGDIIAGDELATDANGAFVTVIA